jgi:hypothetical protein
LSDHNVDVAGVMTGGGKEIRRVLRAVDSRPRRSGHGHARQRLPIDLDVYRRVTGTSPRRARNHTGKR